MAEVGVVAVSRVKLAAALVPVKYFRSVAFRLAGVSLIFGAAP